MKNNVFRIKEITYVNGKEYWVEESIGFFGVHFFWADAHLDSFKTIELAQKFLEGITVVKSEIVK